MRAARLIVACAVVLAVSMIGSLATAERRIAKLRADATQVARVDMGITLHVVRKEPATGLELIRGLPRMTRVDTLYFGGMVEIDGGAARYVGRSENPTIWFASEQQARLIAHDDDLPIWNLIEGSEGSGKTTALAMWIAIRALEHVGTDAEIGVTAPTGHRLGHVRKAIRDTWPAHWFRFSKNADLYTFTAGPRVQLVTATSRSEAGGSPIQGYTWVACASDELQDHFDKEADIEARCRDPRARGRAKRLCSSTQKDSSEWRTFRDTCRDGTGGIWGACKLYGQESPFIYDAHWHALRAAGTMTERDWNRRIKLLDVGPEKQVYFNWRRTFDNGNPASLRAIPDGARDVTAQTLAPWATNAAVLVGHDPGLRQNVSVFLKAYILPSQRKGDDRPRWFAVDEITSPESTIHAHAALVLQRLRDRWYCHGLDRTGTKADPSAPVALVRIDPHTRGGDEHPGSEVVAIWRSLGMTARAAAYKASAHSVEPMIIKRRARIDLVNTLLSAVAEVGEVRRLFVAVNDDGKPAAPMLVKAFETMEFNAAGRAEADAKDADDLSHWPAALGYALWQVEAPRLGMTAVAA